MSRICDHSVVPESVVTLKSKLSKFYSAEGRLKGVSYIPKSADEVIITVPSKSGTTWMQHICHQLRSGYSKRGFDMNFDEISCVVPWIELAHDCNQDLFSAQFGEEEKLPRMFKSHLWEPHCPKGCKYIVVFRDPYDVALSFYNFGKGWWFSQDDISVDDFIEHFWLERGAPKSPMENCGYFDHLLSFYKKRNNPNVLILFYENMKEDLETSVRQVARFISTAELNFDQQHLIMQVTERSTFDFMKRHSEKFNERLSKIFRNEACGFPRNAGMDDNSGSKVVNGRSGEGRIALSSKVRAAIHSRWSRDIYSETGFENYDSFRKSFSN